MSAKKFTVLIIPEGSHRVRRYVLERPVMRAIVAMSLVLVSAFSVAMWDYARTKIDESELYRLRVENQTQMRELQRLALNLADLRKEMVVLAQNDAKVRVMAKLAGPKGDLMNGVGGPLEVDSGSGISELQRQIDSIRMAIDLRRDSQEEVQGFLNDQRSFLGATPQGWPVKGWLTSTFGMRKSPFSGRMKMHEGLDVAARTGTPVYTTADGVVSRAETAAGYGKLVVIDHGYGYRTYYGHNSKIYVKVGQRVKRGDKITAVGNTGTSTGSHLHYEVRMNGVPLNPHKFI
ncbi:MAG: hypothetical protein C0624_12245 [Desulfuromonas sp.]|nr:MAG: hypothetical protein C0624_12245 [Desulfuromonas sp.]